jgi:hypothetical protein
MSVTNFIASRMEWQKIWNSVSTLLMSWDMRFMIYCSIHSLQCYNPANDQCTNTCSRLTSGTNRLPATGFYGMMKDGATKIKVAADLLFPIWQTIQFWNTVMVTWQSEIHMRGTRQVPTWYMDPPAYPPWWGAFSSHPPFLWPHKAVSGPIKRGARVCNSHTKMLQVFGTL